MGHHPGNDDPPDPLSLEMDQQGRFAKAVGKMLLKNDLPFKRPDALVNLHPLRIGQEEGSPRTG